METLHPRLFEKLSKTYYCPRFRSDYEGWKPGHTPMIPIVYFEYSFRSDYEGWKQNHTNQNMTLFHNYSVLEVTMRDGNQASKFVNCHHEILSWF